MRILYYHVPDLKDYMIPTWNLMQYLSMKGIRVIDCPTPPQREFAMGDELIKHWGYEDIIIVGQDNLPTRKMIDELSNCKHDLCVNPCISYPASTALERPMLNQIDENGRMYEETERPKFVYYGGTGVSKISLKAQKDHMDIIHERFGFPMFDSTLFHNGFVNWHCHYPIHKHSKDRLEYKHWQNSS